MVYAATVGNKRFVVVDGIEGRQYDDMLEGGEISAPPIVFITLL